MKKKITFLLLFFSTLVLNAQSSTCSNATPYCAVAGVLTFPNTTNFPDDSPISCLDSTPNQTWFYLQTSVAGTINFSISQTSNTGTPLDVDYVAWGPFSNPSCSASDLSPANLVGCSYSSSNVENLTISNAQVNQIYMVLITNFSGQAGLTTFAQTNYGLPGAGSTDCNINCPLQINGGVTNCYDNLTTLTATISGATSYQWSSSVSGPILGNTQSITVSQSATYTVVVNKPGCVANATASTEVYFSQPMNINPAVNLSQCSSNLNAVFDLTHNIPIILGSLNPSDYEVYFYLNEDDVYNLSNPITNPNSFTNNLSPQVIYYNVINNYGCIETGTFQLFVNPIQNPNVIATVTNNTITIETTDTGNFLYQLDNGFFQNSPIFNNVSLGNHTVTVNNTNGCGSTTVTVTITMPLAPLAVSPQYFNTGQTLQNLMVDGQNIQWYANAINKNSSQQVVSTPLPLTTLLVDGTTYFASQTINGVESVERIPILTLFTTLSNTNFALSNLNYYPNPVNNSLIISNLSVIDEVIVTSVIGQKMLSKKVNELQTEIEMSSLSNGIYFVKVTSEGQEKMVKIIKE
jgi:hypothetical protein